MYSNPYQWKRIRKRVLINDESIRSVAKSEGMSRTTLRKILSHEAPPLFKGRRPACRAAIRPEGPILSRAENERVRWQEWIYKLERGDLLEDPLIQSLDGLSTKKRKLLIAVMAKLEGFSISAIAEHIGLTRTTVRKHLDVYESQGLDAVLSTKPRKRIIDNPSFCKALFSLLHEPPSLSGYNRTSWRLSDLRETLAKKGHDVGADVIRQAIKIAGFKWKSAKVVLTSSDPEYREKLERVQSVLMSLGEDERFFSVDEYGPFAIKAKGGRILVPPGTNPSVPQWQKSKGWLIATAALELSRNQITHFYSRAKNTAEMIKMINILVLKYKDVRTIYLSWDAASWHMSKDLLAFVDEHNVASCHRPRIELVPLPASAQFLNVIESVFSGMARAIIHNSNYPSVQAACEAIDRYFAERNQHYANNPKRAGHMIWGRERTEVRFDPANNCKDPTYR